MTETEGAVREVTAALVEQVVRGLAEKREIPATAQVTERTTFAPRRIVARGTLEEVNDTFHKRLWTDGLPIVPPTVDRIERFLHFTDLAAHDVLGVLPPGKQEASVWSVATNGVMAGCRPEHMPILVAIVQAIADPVFNLEDAGSTAGWEPLVILSGPAVKEFDFNAGRGVTRIGRHANSSVGRFLRLYMRNVAGLRIPPGSYDMATFGVNFNVVLAEAPDAIAELDWPSFGNDRGHPSDQSVVTVQGTVGASTAVASAGDHALDHMRTISEAIGLGTWSQWAWCGFYWGEIHPLLVLSPSIAKVLARDGWTKQDVRRYLSEHILVTAESLERLAWANGATQFSLRDLAAEGRIPEHYAYDSPDELLPAFCWPDDIGIVVAGDPYRNRSMGYAQPGQHGSPVTKAIRM